MSLTLRVLMFAIALSTTGCHLALEALTKHNQEVRTEKTSVHIKKACSERDTAELKKYVHAPDDANRGLALRCYTEIKYEALMALDCDGFVGAFERVETKKGNSVQSTRNDLVDFTLEGYEDTEERQAKALSFVEKAHACRATRVLFGSHRHAVVRDGVDWMRLLEQLDETELYAMLRADIRAKNGVVESSANLKLDHRLADRNAGRGPLRRPERRDARRAPLARHAAPVLHAQEVRRRDARRRRRAAGEQVAGAPHGCVLCAARGRRPHAPRQDEAPRRDRPGAFDREGTSRILGVRVRHPPRPRGLPAGDQRAGDEGRLTSIERTRRKQLAARAASGMAASGMAASGMAASGMAASGMARYAAAGSLRPAGVRPSRGTAGRGPRGTR